MRGHHSRLYLSLAAACAMTLALLMTSTASAAGKAQPATCPGVYFIAYHGTGETGYGTPGDVLIKLDKLGTIPNGIASRQAAGLPYIPLPSSPDQWVKYLRGGNMDPGKGADQIRSLSNNCKGAADFALVGYSYGAADLHFVLNRLAAEAPKKPFNMAEISVVATLGDPFFPSGTKAAPRQGIVRAVTGLDFPFVPAQIPRDRWDSVCMAYNLAPPTVKKAYTAYDPICLAPPHPPAPLNNVDLENCLSHTNTILCPHTRYAQRGATQATANWLARVLGVHH